MDSYYELSMEQEVALDRAAALADPELTRKVFGEEIRRESKECLAIWLEEILSLESMADYLQDNQL
tara:strand:+ start:3244 stop:3441 length:198 start_codon:yes stop_codon:yes gene_type:complete